MTLAAVNALPFESGEENVFIRNLSYTGISFKIHKSFEEEFTNPCLYENDLFQAFYDIKLVPVSALRLDTISRILKYIVVRLVSYKDGVEENSISCSGSKIHFHHNLTHSCSLYFLIL